MCPECGRVYQHGQAGQCVAEACIVVNAPLDCAGCHRVVADNRRGVLTLSKELHPYKDQGDRLKLAAT